MHKDRQSPPAKKASAQPLKTQKPTVVGIGASAGGLAALRTFFRSVPENSGLTFVVVVHLSPEHESHLADLLQPHVRMPVQQVTETMALEPNHVYVIPPNANLNTIDTHLRLSELEEQRRERAPIDHFFRTLANTHDGAAVGVVLTGTGSDGTLGIKEIKANGGFVIVQDPNEAEYDGMPQSAIATGFADFILPVAEIPATILRFEGLTPRLKIDASAQTVEQEEERLLQKIFAQLRARTDRDFSRYKRSTILRRVARRMQINYVEDLDAYLKKLRSEQGEVHSLADDLLITVTNFFRDPEVFEKLATDVLPSLFAGKGADDSVRVWSVGCATGEEAYSFAMLLVEEAERHDTPPQIQLFASDLHQRSISKAREGFYPGDIATDVAPQRLARFFQKENGGYRIRKELRDLVVFAPHNLLSDPPFSRLDLIVCRNLLIYLQRDVQQDVVDLFHYALRTDGWLLLGSAETLESADLFHTADKNFRFYRKRNVQAPDPRLPVFPLTGGRPPADSLHKLGPSADPVGYGNLLHRMLERYAPPSVLIDPDNKLVQLSEDAGRYLVHPGGSLTANVFKLVREELRADLRTAVHTARAKRSAFDSKPVPVRFNGKPLPVILRVRPALEPTEDGFLLVIFDERQSLRPPAAPNKPGAAPPKGSGDTRVAELETELAVLRQRLQAIVEEYETSQEEMKASNEEMQSSNEELRSTMEELETSKEELQSINEELQTVNQENRHKVEELAQLSGDLQNLLAATDIATLFLDRKLCIMRFTPKISELFNAKTTDRGRPISDLTHRLGYPDLQADAQAVLDRLIPIEREIRDEDGGCYLTRLRPYRSTEDQIEGVVLTFVDITRRVEAEKSLLESEERYGLLMRNAREYAIVILDPEGRVTNWNVGAERTFGYQEAEILGRPADILFTKEDRAAGVPRAEMETAARDGLAADDRWQVRKDGSLFWASGSMESLVSRDGSVRCFAKVLRDNTERKEAEESLRRLNETLEARVENRTQQVRDLSAHLTLAEHRERDRIARILHDDLQQLLFSVQLKLMFLRESLASSDAASLLDRAEEAEKDLAEGIRIAQNLSVDLSPQVLDTEGLREMLHWLAEQVRQKHGLDVVIEAGDSFPAPRALRVLLFQAVRELLFNVIKHAEVKQATVELHLAGDEFLVGVRDHGKGFVVSDALEKAGYGVRSIQHRLSLMGGLMEFDSRPGGGTMVTLRVPLQLFEERDG